MPNDQPVTGTNDTPNQYCPIDVDCDLLWSQAQEFSYLRLSDEQDNGDYELIGLYAARARRIAATYARFYLETEDGGDHDKRGRYYWMALGAFASKTVACLLDKWQLQGSYFFGWLTRDKVDSRKIANGLAKGNLWLFSDIAPAHWFYNNHPEHFFDGMACLQQRHANSLHEPVKEILNSLPWSSESLGVIDHFVPSGDLVKGFRYVRSYEQQGGRENQERAQMKHLMAIADHEQGAILQPLIYDDPAFSSWTAFQRRSWVRWASPTYELVFSHECSAKDEELKSVAPDDMVVEDFESRMKWIEKAAKKFDGLMKKKSSYMRSEIATIARWVDSPDAKHVY
ncbi:DUF2515 family protein [Marinimicrobium locisalis]|uniref:DUF2515 family protein n=1 Tax=Marinimicrobium locisalis TaxID=546022 RepID=UPI003221D2DF